MQLNLQSHSRIFSREPQGDWESIVVVDRGTRDLSLRGTSPPFNVFHNKTHNIHQVVMHVLSYQCRAG